MLLSALFNLSLLILLPKILSYLKYMSLYLTTFNVLYYCPHTASYIDLTVSASPQLLLSFLATSNPFGDTPNTIISQFDLKKYSYFLCVFFKCNQMRTTSFFILPVPNHMHLHPKILCILLKQKSPCLYLRLLPSTFSLHLPLESFSRFSPTTISSLSPSISPYPGSFQSGISIAHDHPLKQSPLTLFFFISFLCSSSQQNWFHCLHFLISQSFHNPHQITTPLKQLKSESPIHSHQSKWSIFVHISLDFPATFKTVDQLLRQHNPPNFLTSLNTFVQSHWVNLFLLLASKF